MRNKVMETQINTQQLSVATFRQSLEIYATKDDGIIDKEEQKIIRKVTKACIKFEKALDKTRSDG